MTAVVFSAELIGPGFDWTHRSGASEAWPWVAELVGLCPTWGFRRYFLRPVTDASGANAKGTRGVWLHWNLRSGRIYEAKYLASPRARWTRRLLTVTDGGEVLDMNRQEVLQWLDG